MDNNKQTVRIAKNSVLLYIRMAFLMVVNLYTTRIVVKAIGVEDFGIYNVVAGAITMLNCVSVVLSTATQRFYSYYQGANQFDKLKDIFSASFYIFGIVSILTLVLGESLGLWFVNSRLVIPADRIFAANIIYQFSIIGFILSMLQVPYYAAMISHEDMGVFAIATSIEYLLKLFLALLIPYVPFDKLSMYGFTLLFAQCSIFLFYVGYGIRNYPECRLCKIKDKKVVSDIINFSGWTLFGQVAGVGMNQVNTILVNIFYGSISTSARAISLQVSTALTSFCNSFIMAVRPPMIKAYADKNIDGLNRLFNISNKFVYYSLFVICAPLIIDMHLVLKLWLGIDNENTILFSQLIVIYTFILALNNPISIIVQATGDVKKYNLWVEMFTLFCPVLTYMLFLFNMADYYVCVSMISCIVCSHVVRIYIIKSVYPQFKTSQYLLDFLSRSIIISTVVLAIVISLRMKINNELLSFVVTLFATFIFTILLAFFFGFNKSEREYIASIFNSNKR